MDGRGTPAQGQSRETAATRLTETRAANNAEGPNHGAPFLKKSHQEDGTRPQRDRFCFNQTKKKPPDHNAVVSD